MSVFIASCCVLCVCYDIDVVECSYQFQHVSCAKKNLQNNDYCFQFYFMQELILESVNYVCFICVTHWDVKRKRTAVD
jgi:hypothetical protein